MPTDFVQDCDLTPISKNGKALVEIRKGMHVLKQAIKKYDNMNLIHQEIRPVFIMILPNR